jgi:hypothetical protein
VLGRTGRVQTSLDFSSGDTTRPSEGAARSAVATCDKNNTAQRAKRIMDAKRRYDKKL